MRRKFDPLLYCGLLVTEEINMTKRRRQDPKEAEMTATIIIDIEKGQITGTDIDRAVLYDPIEGSNYKSSLAVYQLQVFCELGSCMMTE